MATASGWLAFKAKKDGGGIDPFAQLALSQFQWGRLGECEHRDRNLNTIVEMIEAGLPALQLKHPTFQKPKVKYGIRGVRYYIEFPITARRIDAFSYVVKTEQLLQQGKKEFGAKITSHDSFVKGDNMSYLIDYSCKSTQTDGAYSKGSVYIRGVKSDEGYDSFKFVLEKNNDFSALDCQIILNAMEEAHKQNPPAPPEEPAPRRGGGAGTRDRGSDPMSNQTG